ncbi:MAG: cell envelope integrity protein TolA, partial [Deltaproteobacteria bacterium]|nr:cell envelope integrity protein TolA [Deltaproteobacteria bacterium]
TKEPIAKEAARETKAEAGSESGSLDNVRERIMQAAAERAKNRNESAQKSSKGEGGGSGGPGEGEGAAGLGKGGRGGGMEHSIYRNRMLETIKENWAWPGRGNIKVEVYFSIKANGEIAGLKVVQTSGDASFDESVLRAVRKSSPLPPPPEGFSNFWLTARPQDLGA